MRTSLVVLLGLAAAAACGGGGDDDDDGVDIDGGGGGADGSADDPDAGGALTIPDPGTGDPGGLWQASPASCCGTPSTAFAVGVVTQNNPYVEATAPTDTGDTFYVFRTGAAFTSLTINLFEAGADITAVHVHDGAGLVFGDEIAPTVTTATSGTWPLAANSVYVFEVITAAGGFF